MYFFIKFFKNSFQCSWDVVLKALQPRSAPFDDCQAVSFYHSCGMLIFKDTIDLEQGRKNGNKGTLKPCISYQDAAVFFFLNEHCLDCSKF